MDNLIAVGKIGKPHGIKGEITVHWDVEIDVDNLKSIFIEIDNTPVPYLVEYCKVLPNKFIIKLKTLSGIEDARRLTNKIVLVKEENLIIDEKYHWLHFTVIDINKNVEIGKITDWITNGNAEWIMVRSQKFKEILLPLHEDLIVNIDKENKILYYRAIEGLY